MKPGKIAGVEAVPTELMDFALLALNHAADSVIGSGGPLTPFSLIEPNPNERAQLTRFVCETLEEGLAKARDRVRNSGDCRRAAVAWDGYLTMDGIRTDAVFVEACQAGSSQSIIVAQRYVAGNEVHRLGDVVVAGVGEPLF